MKFYVAVTDNDWFDFLAQEPRDEVNFWHPGDSSPPRVVVPGTPFLFKLRSPRNHIAGGGFFVRHTVLPLSLVWMAFGEKNGADSCEGFRRIILGIRQRLGRPVAQEIDPMIGCTVLSEPFLFQEPDWVEVPPDWSPNVQKGKTYDTDTSIGERIWTEIRERLPRYQTGAADSIGAEGTLPEQQYGSEYLTRARLGQGAFRVLVTDAYERRCAVTGERTLPVLEAAHIKPFAKSGPNRVNNGLLLRSDIHILFDQGYMTIDCDYRVEVSRRIREKFENGRAYYRLSGKSLQALPGEFVDRPSPEFVEWHNKEVFVP